MFFDILTLFPSMFDGPFSDSIIRRAVERGLVSIHIDNIRDYTHDKHKTVDDYPYGGDAGMLMKPQPLAEAIRSAVDRRKDHSPKVILLTPQGRKLDQHIVNDLVFQESLILICGRYKGVDQRVRDKYVDDELSIGDYVLSGGEIPAMVLVDSIVRLIPGVLGNRDSAEKDSHFQGLLSPPQYTRPEVFEDMKVPDILLSGHHRKIVEWQEQCARELTKNRRPDLWERYIQQNREKQQ